MAKHLGFLIVVTVVSTGCPDELQFSAPSVGSAGADSSIPSLDIGSAIADAGSPPADIGGNLSDANNVSSDVRDIAADIGRTCSAEFGEPCISGESCCGSGVACINGSAGASAYCTRGCLSDCDCPSNWACAPATSGRLYCIRSRANGCSAGCSLPEGSACQAGSASSCCADGRICGQQPAMNTGGYSCCRTQGACSVGFGCCSGFLCRFGSCVAEGTRECDGFSLSNSGCPSDFPKCLPYTENGGGWGCFENTGSQPVGSSCSRLTDCALGHACDTSRTCRRLCRTSSPQCPTGQVCVPLSQFQSVGICRAL